MANQNIRTPRFYIDDINYQLSRGVAQGNNFDVMATGSNRIGIKSGGGSEIELFDMRPLNLVTFDTAADPDGGVVVTIDKGSTTKKTSFIAILNHNLINAGGRFRITSSDTETDVNVFKTADAAGNGTEVNPTAIVNGTVEGSTPFEVAPVTNGSTIVTFDENNDKFFGIQFEGADGTFESTDLTIGCILMGEFYDMPHAPELSVKKSITFDQVSIQKSIGGQKFSNMTSFGRTASSTSKSPFSTSSFAQNIYGGRISYDMNFNYLQATDLMPNEYVSIKDTDDAVIEDIWNKTNGNHLPFIFSIDNTSVGSGSESEHIFARFGQNSLDMTQVAPDVFNISMRIEEEF